MKYDILAYARGFMREYTQYKNGWNYEDSCILTAAQDFFEATKDRFYRDFILAYTERFVQPDGSIPAFELKAYSVDNIAPGRPLFFALRETGDSRYEKAIEFHMNRLRTHPRCPCGNYWHKEIYPNQVWLDGLYMAQPFRLLYDHLHRDSHEAEDVLRQFSVVRSKMFNAEKGLYYHGWDESLEQPWADKATGLSPNFWSRAMGWYLMALVDCTELLASGKQAEREKLAELFREAIAGLLQWTDKDTGLIFQVIDRADVKDNYLETSGSSMLCYALFKGVRLGLLSRDSCLPAAQKAWQGLLRTKVIQGEDGRLHVKDMCKVAGLGPGNARDGSVAYYLSEERGMDEVKGTAAFLMAFSETLRA